MTARASDSMFYPLTMCALQIVFMIMIMIMIMIIYGDFGRKTQYFSTSLHSVPAYGVIILYYAKRQHNKNTI